MPVHAPSPADQRATVQAVRDHHARLGRTLADHTLTLARTVDQLSSPSQRRDVLVRFCADEVLPHAAAEEETLYRAAAELPATRLLVRAMSAEHILLRDLLGTLAAARTSAEIVGAAAALNAVFQAHLDKENELLLPALVEEGLDLAGLLAGADDICGEPAGHHCACGGGGGGGGGGGCGGGGCGCGGGGCGGHDADAEPDHGAHTDPYTGGETAGDTAWVVTGELDVRQIPHAERHPRIFAAYEALLPGTAFMLLNDHDPRPVSYQLAAQYPGGFSWEPVETGPEVWRTRVGRH
jgi:uncharacterized protein (DUF2249 family)